jgi:hypothetical protein
MNAKQSGTHWLGELHHLTEVDLNKLRPGGPMTPSIGFCAIMVFKNSTC